MFWRSLGGFWMLLRLRVENWANREFFEVRFKEGCNLVFGPNYSGKSSLLNAVFIV